MDRPRLFAALDGATAAPVTLISGSAGSGKSSLVRSWLDMEPRAPSVGWVTVEPAEHDGARFWDSVWQALPLDGPSGTPGSLGAMTDRALLVLDDVHELQARDALDELDSMLGRLPLELRMILIGRRAASAGLRALLGPAGLTEIDEADLRFTRAEGDELLIHAGVSLSVAGLERLMDHTEGWAVGLSLAGSWLAARHDPDRSVADFSGSQGAVADYLMDEVLSAQPPPVRHLLLRTCLLDRVNGPLADLLTGEPGGEGLLQGLEDEHAMVSSVEAEGSWFRYHPLLSDLLRAQLRRKAPEELDGLHLQAARWYAEHDMAEDAIRQAQAGKDWHYAGEVLADAWFELFLDGRQARIGTLLGHLPPQIVSDDGELVNALAADHLAHGRHADADILLALADRLASSVAEPRRRRFDIALAVVKLMRSRNAGSIEATLEEAGQIVASLPTPSEPSGIADEDLRALVLMNLGFVELWSLRLADADDHLAEAVELARRNGRQYVAVGSLGVWAEVALMSHRLDLAERRSREAIELADGLGWPGDPVVGPACSTLAGVLFIRGQLEEGEHWLGRAEQALHGLVDLESSMVLRFRRGWLHYVRGQDEEALACFRAAQRARELLGASHFLSRLTETWQGRVLIRLGDVDVARSLLDEAGGATAAQPELALLGAILHLEQGDPDAAVAALTPILDGSAPVIHETFRIEALFLEAVARERLGERAAARQALERALDLAEPDGHLWPVLTVPAAAPLLERYVRGARRHRAFAARSLHRFAAETTARDAAAEGLRGPLTDRESTILPFLATNLAAAEIASELHVSVHTVKTHMRNIYRKLDAHRRSEAVSHARAAGLLPPP